MMRLSILFLCAFLTTCQCPTDSQTPAKDTNDENTTEIVRPARITKEEAQKIAQRFMAANQGEFSSEVIKDEITWYNPTVEGPAYIEFVTSGNDYIFVSLTDADIPVPQYGKGSIHERLVKESGSALIKPYKFSNLDFVATDEKAGHLLGKLRLRGAEEVDPPVLRRVRRSPEPISELFDRYKKFVKGNAGAISVHGEYLQTVNEGEPAEEPDFTFRPVLLSSTEITDTSWTAVLNNYKTKLPAYNQFWETFRSGSTKRYPSGCTPTAFAMALGYWYLEHGKTKLFEEKPALTLERYPLDENIAREVRSLREYFKTSYDGLTYSSNSVSGIEEYLNSKGYSKDKIWLRYYTDMYDGDDWYYIANNIHFDIPTILNYKHYDKEDGQTKKDGAGHSTVIYKVRLVSHDSWSSYNRAGFDVYLGWGLDSETKKPEEDYVSSQSHELRSAVGLSFYS